MNMSKKRTCIEGIIIWSAKAVASAAGLVITFGTMVLSIRKVKTYCREYKKL